MVEKLVEKVRGKKGSKKNNPKEELRIEGLDNYFLGIKCARVEEGRNGKKRVIMLPTIRIISKLDDGIRDYGKIIRLGQKYAESVIGFVSRLPKDEYEVYVGSF